MGQRRVNTSLSIQSNCFIQTLGPRVIEPDMHNQSTWHDLHQVRAVLFKTKMRALKTEQAREAFRLEHHEEMKIRATARGVTLPNEPLAKGLGIQGLSLRVQAKAALLVTQAQAMLAMPAAGASKALIGLELSRG